MKNLHINEHVCMEAKIYRGRFYKQIDSKLHCLSIETKHFSVKQEASRLFQVTSW